MKESKYIHPRTSNNPVVASENLHVIVEGGYKGSPYIVSVVNGELGGSGWFTAFHEFKVQKFTEAKKLANMLVETFGLQGWEDVAHDPINRP
jgi:hypothetical protein